MSSEANGATFHFLTELNNDSIESTGLDFSPKTFDDYLGQEELKKKLHIYAQAAVLRSHPLDHILLSGPPGLGKTTLARILANHLKVGIKICSGPMLERTGDLVALLTSLTARDIFFIDEIHRLPISVEEVLYTAMEEFRVDVIIGQGAGAKSVNLPLAPFTLVGATTKSGMLSAPLRSRFGINERLEFYTDQELQNIVIHTSTYLGFTLTLPGALRVAQSSRGTPRIAKKLVRRIRDILQVQQLEIADEEFVLKALEFLGIDSDGLSKQDNKLLKILLERGNGAPIGLETLAALLGEDPQTIEEEYEPFLLRKNYLEKTPRGRQISFKALPYLQRKYYGQHTIENH